MNLHRGTSHTTALSREGPWDAKVPPALWALGGILCQTRFIPRPAPKAVKGVALLLLMASASLGLWAVHGFREQTTTLDPHRIHDASSLVTSGAHSVSRNPMYTALLGGLVSVALWRGRGAALLPVIAVWAALDRWQVAPEEAALTYRFGEEFDRYRTAVPRWL